GTAEEEAAEWVKANMTKPVVGFISGATAPAGKRMGHAGAIISGGKGTADEKIRVMKACGIKVAETTADIRETMIQTLKENNIAEKCQTHYIYKTEIHGHRAFGFPIHIEGRDVLQNIRERLIHIHRFQGISRR